MSQRVREVTALHNKFERERADRRNTVSRAAVALGWWERSSVKAESVMDEAITTLEVVSEFRWNFLQWLSYCPWKWVRWIGRQSDKGPSGFIHVGVKRLRFEFKKWRTHQLMGGDVKYSAKQLQNKTNSTEAEMKTILGAIERDETERIKLLRESLYIFKQLEDIPRISYFIRPNGDRGEAKVYLWDEHQKEETMAMIIKYPFQTMPVNVVDYPKPVIFHAAITFEERSKQQAEAAKNAVIQSQPNTPQHNTITKEEKVNDQTIATIPT
jgi:hypothetical protein